MCINTYSLVEGVCVEYPSYSLSAESGVQVHVMLAGSADKASANKSHRCHIPAGDDGSRAHNTYVVCTR
jgi:hypothetical protein